MEMVDTPVGYCGLYCENCPLFRRGEIRDTAHKLQRHLRGYEKYAEKMSEKHQDLRDYQVFLDVISWFASRDCPGCRDGGGLEGCQIKVCCLGKGHELCSQCDIVHCEKVHGWMITNTNRIREIGIKAFIAEEDSKIGFE